jgi:hypothetical protein
MDPENVWKTDDESVSEVEMTDEIQKNVIVLGFSYFCFKLNEKDFAGCKKSDLMDEHDNSYYITEMAYVVLDGLSYSSLLSKNVAYFKTGIPNQDWNSVKCEKLRATIQEQHVRFGNKYNYGELDQTHVFPLLHEILVKYNIDRIYHKSGVFGDMVLPKHIIAPTVNILNMNTMEIPTASKILETLKRREIAPHISRCRLHDTLEDERERRQFLRCALHKAILYAFYLSQNNSEMYRSKEVKIHRAITRTELLVTENI